MGNKKNKKKKEKVKYIDDGRTVADMSGTSKGGLFLPSSNRQSDRPRSSFKEIWKTYWNAVKMMFVPMLVVLGAMTLVFLMMYLSMR